MIQKKIGDFKVTNKLLGKGTFGNVYLGYNLHNQKNQVAVKVIDRNRLQNHLIQYFESEITALKNCVSDHIVKLYDIKKTQKHCYIFLEYCNQGDLNQYIKKKGKLKQQEALEFFYQIVRGFKVIIKNQLIHRDLKPANIFIKDGKIKIGDFGLSKFMCQKNMANTFAGSPFNMAPEVLKHQQYDNKADIYGIGTILYEMIFGTPPFVGLSIPSMIQQINSQRLNNFDKKLISTDTYNLLIMMLKIQPQKRISWEELFNYQFRKNQKYSIKQYKKYEQFLSKNIKNIHAIQSIFYMYNIKINKSLGKISDNFDIKFLDEELSSNLLLTLMNNTEFVQNNKN